MPAPPQIRSSKDKDTAVLVYKLNRCIRVPATIGIPADRRIFMEFVEGIHLLDAPLDYESRRNLMMQTQKHASLTLVLLGWSHAGRCSALLRHARDPWRDRSDFYRSELPTRTLAGPFPKIFAIAKKIVGAFRKFARSSIQEAQESPGALTTKTKKRRKEKT